MDDSFLKGCLREVENNVWSTPKKVPAHRKLSNQNYSFSRQPSADQLHIWDFIWNHATDPWVRAQAFFYSESKIKDEEFLISSWQILRTWQKKVDNWGDCDALSKIYTKILEVDPDAVLAQLKKWNFSTNLWDRRQSLVSLLYFSRTKKVFLPFDTIIHLIDNLLADPEYYVQKAVGWSLKELYNVYPNETLNYVTVNIQRVPPIAFTTATEKYTREDKENLKKRRRNIRMKQK